MTVGVLVPAAGAGLRLGPGGPEVGPVVVTALLAARSATGRHPAGRHAGGRHAG